MTKKRPNLIWIFGDQHRAQAMSHRGDPNLSTPNLDRLAVQGLSFDKALVNSPLCCPARGTLLTGRYSHQAVEGHEIQLDPTIPTLAQAYREHGYHTAWFGKWHLDGYHESHGRAAFHQIPRERRGGFDTWIGYENNNSPFDCWVHGHEGETNCDLHRLEGFETDALTDLFIKNLETQANGGPFFAALSVQPPHNPYAAPERWMAGKSPAKIVLRPNVPEVKHVTARATQELSGYYASIENLDWNVGRIVEALERLGLYSNTHILFFSDHGDLHGSHGQFMKTSPLEESIRIPMIMGGIDPVYGVKRGNSSALLSVVDIPSTSLGLCGIPVPKTMIGSDLSGLRLPKKGAPRVPDSAFLQMVKPTRHPDSPDRAWRGIVTDDGWKYVCIEGGVPWLMFNLNEDPYEQVNLALNTGYLQKRHELQQRLGRWIEQTGDHFDLPAIPK